MTDHLPNPHKPALVGPHVLGFMPDLSPEDREDILYATGFAFDTTLKAPHLQDPVAYHRNQLRYLGWDCGTVGALPSVRAGEVFSDEIVRDIDRVGLPGTANTVADALGALAHDSNALSVFEQHAFEGAGVSFQIMANSKVSGSRVSVLLYRRRYTVRKQVSRFLFAAFDDSFCEVSSQFEVVNFNLAAYRQSKQAVVAERMQRISAGFLVEMARGLARP